MNSSPSRNLKVFLCHGREDKPAVLKIYERLKADGIEPWLDERDLIGGQDWRLEITRAVRTSDILLVCLSRVTVTKESFVQAEIKLGLDVAKQKPAGTIFLIPLRLTECEIPDRLSGWHWINYYETDGYDRLKRALAARAEQLGVKLHAGNPP